VALIEGEVATNDGVAVMFRGDVLLILYEKDARLHRTRFLFDRADEVARHASDAGLIAFMIVLPTAAPPDSETRAENVARLHKLGSQVRLLVTTPVGDAFRMSVVRAVMRALAILQRRSRTNVVASTIEDGLARVMEAAGPLTPPKSVILADLYTLYAALGVELEMPRRRAANE
jgi:hypothetical protein